VTNRIPDLGVQDPDLRNSPVAWEADEDTETLRASLPGEPICLFNNQAYGHGTVGKSGTVLLRCDHGLWIPDGPADPENP
jgi:Protein of unknown function (DUF1496)